MKGWGGGLNPCAVAEGLGGVQSEPKGPVIDSSICGGAPGRLGNMLKHSTV